jgi:hypothetical protein
LTIEAYVNVDSFNGTFAGPIGVKATLILDGVQSATVTSTLSVAKVDATALVPANNYGTVDLITSPNNTNATLPIVLKARDHGIVAFNVCIPPGDLVIFEVYIDLYLSNVI